MNTTRGQLKGFISDEFISDPNFRISNQEALNRAINHAVRIIQSDTSFSLPENVRVITVSGGPEFVMPNDFEQASAPSSVKMGGRLLTPASYVDLVGRGDMDLDGTADYYYTREEDGDKIIGVYPRQTGNLTIAYNRSLGAMELDTDESPLPPEYDHLVTFYALFLLFKRYRGYEDKARDYLDFYNEEKRKVLNTTLFRNRPLMMRSIRERRV